MTRKEMEELIELQTKQIADLTAERDRLKVESSNATGALIASNESNERLSNELSDATDALGLLGVEEDAV